MKLRLKLYPTLFLLALACCGCFSVELQTTVNPRGGGSRTIEIVMDPMMAGIYQKTNGSGKLFKIPGQGLQEKPGVKLAGFTKTGLDDGSLKLAWDYRAGRAGLFSAGNDSVMVNITRSGLWVYYRYLEEISASKPEPDTTNAGKDIYRLRHQLVMPGQIISHNADSARSGSLVWNRPLGQVTSSGLVMKAASREINPVYLLIAVILLLAAGGIVFGRRHQANKIT